jgi:hypothetical protein
MIELAGTVRVGVDHDRCAGFDGCSDHRAVSVESRRVAVHLDRDVVFGGRGGQFVNVHFEPGAAVDESAGGVAEDIYLGVFDSPHEPVGRILAALIQRAVG